jgi:hypothetical protein
MKKTIHHQRESLPLRESGRQTPEDGPAIPEHVPGLPKFDVGLAINIEPAS